MDTPDRLHIFTTVARLCSFTRAADELNMSPSGVSKHISMLEERLGVPLFYRTTRKVGLTEQGTLFFDYCRDILERYEEAESAVRLLSQKPMGTLRVGAPLSFSLHGFDRCLAAFAKQYPDITLNLSLDDTTHNMLERGCDVAIRIGNLPDSSLIARKLAPCPMGLYAAPAYLAEAPPLERPEDLTHHAFLAYALQQDAALEWHYGGPGGDTGAVTLTPRMTVDNGEMLATAAREGLGITLLPTFIVADDLATERLVPVLPAWQTVPDRNIYALTPRKGLVPFKVRVFLDFLEQWFRTRG